MNATFDIERTAAWWSASAFQSHTASSSPNAPQHNQDHRRRPRDLIAVSSAMPAANNPATTSATLWRPSSKALPPTPSSDALTKTMISTATAAVTVMKTRRDDTVAPRSVESATVRYGWSRSKSPVIGQHARSVARMSTQCGATPTGSPIRRPSCRLFDSVLTGGESRRAFNTVTTVTRPSLFDLSDDVDFVSSAYLGCADVRW